MANLIGESALRKSIPRADERTTPRPSQARIVNDRTVDGSALGAALVISADPVVRSAWAQRLFAARAVQTITEASTVSEACLRTVANRSDDLTILQADLSGPAESARTLDRVGALRRSGCDRLVVVTERPDPEAVRTLLRAGVRACLFPSALMALVPSPVEPSPAPAQPGSQVRGAAEVSDINGTTRELSRRELQVLQCAADGQPNREIGVSLNVSALTVKSHMSRIARKLGTGDRSQMVFLALRAGAIL